MITRPLLKWTGGKSALVDDIVKHIGPHVLARRKRYFEPFMGGAALFWRLHDMGQGPGSVLSDANAELVSCYHAVRDDAEGVVLALEHRASEYGRSGADYYYAVRECDVNKMGPNSRASRTIFLNKTGYNGLYRVNRKGTFNVPHGRTASGAPPVICDADNLRACSRALQGAELYAWDFESMLRGADPTTPGDLVYLDPPYEPEPGKASFAAYTAGGASATLQEDVATTFRILAARGVYVVASNSDTPKIRELYRGFRQIELARPGGMSSDRTKRGKVRELLMLGWERT